MERLLSKRDVGALLSKHGVGALLSKRGVGALLSKREFLFTNSSTNRRISLIAGSSARTNNGSMFHYHDPARKGTRCLRNGRTFIEQQVYHVTTTTKNRAALFSSLPSARSVVRSMMRIEKSQIANTWAFVVMPDHVHWLFQLGHQSSLSACVGSMKFQVATSLKKYQHIRHGIWQRGFHDHAVRTDENLVAIARYIVANPIRVGIVTKIGDYPHWYSIWV